MRTQSVDLHKLKAATEAAGDTNAGTLVERRRKLIAEAQAVLAEIETLEDDEFTDQEKSAIDAAGKSLEALDKDIARFTKSAQVVANFGTASTEGRSGRLNIKAGAAEVARKMADPYGEKALLDAGSAVTSVPLDSTVYEQGRVGTNALDVLPFKQRGPRYSYFRQTTRDNHAAPVAPGALKPTSSYGLTSIDGKLEVVAHLAEPLNEYDVTDNSSLQQFVQTELLYGLDRAVETQVIGGNGTAPNLRGILSTSGIQSVAFAEDRTVSIRKALTAIEKAGHAATTLIVSPDDWEALELTRRTTGEPDLGSALPVDRAAQRLWGLKVAVSVALAPGTAIVFDPSALAVVGDGAIRTQWSTSVGDDFERNLIRARCEGRFGLDIYKPLGIAKVALTAA